MRRSPPGSYSITRKREVRVWNVYSSLTNASLATVDMIVTIYPQLFGDDTELPRLKAWYAAMAALPGIAEYLSARPQLGARKQGNPGSLMYDGQSASSGSYCVSS